MSKRRSVSRSNHTRAEYPRSVPSRRLPLDLPIYPVRLLAPPIIRETSPVRRPPHPVRPYPRPSSPVMARLRSLTQIKRIAPLTLHNFNTQLSLHPKVLVCVKRKQRRETLFALNRAGGAGSAPKRHYKRTIDSQFSCKG